MLFRCVNPDCPARLEPLLQPFEFWEDDPICPECCETKTVKLTVIHFDPPIGETKCGSGFVACDREFPVGACGSQATAVAAVVNCPACKKTELWQAADALARSEMVQP